jgi:hypothetical protein
MPLMPVPGTPFTVVGCVRSIGRNCVHAVERMQYFTVPPTGRMPPPVEVDAAPPEIPPQVPV